MKAVLMSIQPKFCELIASGKKTVEVRKTKPKLETPFKVYIYCTKDKDNLLEFLKAYPKEKYLEIGFDDYLSKPIEKPELQRVLKKFLNNEIEPSKFEPIPEDLYNISDTVVEKLNSEETTKEDIEAFVINNSKNNENILMMSSSTFDGLDLKALANKIIKE